MIVMTTLMMMMMIEIMSFKRWLLGLRVAAPAGCIAYSSMCTNIIVTQRTLPFCRLSGGWCRCRLNTSAAGLYLLHPDVSAAAALSVACFVPAPFAMLLRRVYAATSTLTVNAVATGALHLLSCSP